MDTTYSGTCFCGTVKLAATGTPAAMGYCHCESCRHWSAGPVNAFTLWDPDALKVTAGADSIGTYHRRRAATASGAGIAADTCSPSIPA